MDIPFTSKDLEQLCLDERKQARELGSSGARRLRTRLAELSAATNVGALVAGRPHPLVADRAGQFALDLDAGRRLVFEPADAHAPRTASGAIDWHAVRSVRIAFIGETMTDARPFLPSWVSPPGDTVADLLEERGWTGASLAERLGVTPKYVSELLHGKATISAEMAGRLSLVLGSTAEFWLTREAQYRAALERRSAEVALEQQSDWLTELPLEWMVRQGWVDGHESKGEQVRACLRWFGVASVNAWRSIYAAPLAAWRASKREERKPGAVAAWMRRAELQATELRCGPWDLAGFKRTLQEARSLTREADPASFMPRLQAACAAHGVAVVFVPAPPGCPISGATRWMTPDKALLALSVRYKADDHLWFSFFHEGGHLVLHGKKLLFLEGMDGLDPDAEAQADRFARDLLISPALAGQLQRLTGEAEIVAFARAIGVSPGVVVGRLQHESLVPFSAFNSLKVRVRWAGEAEEEEG